MSIVLDQLLKRYEGHPVVNNMSLEVADGEFFVLLGPRGSGKSTLLRMIAGLVDTDGGRIVLHGREVTHPPPQARALAHRPEVLLLDEPFGALDARIRTELRRTVHSIQRELRITTIFVTHDQEEAFELADRMGVMNFGRLLEVGPPNELYLRPQTEFVATFLGSANLMVGEVTRDGVRLGPVHFPLSTRPAAVGEARRVQVLFRPEDVAVKTSADALDGRFWARRWWRRAASTVRSSGCGFVFRNCRESARSRRPRPSGGISF